jgi:hypothetical protein
LDKKNELIQNMGNFIRAHIPNIKLFETILENTAEAQLQSKRQFNENITIDELKTITFNKCGNAFLLIRSILPEVLTDQESDAIFQYGGTAQIGDDILDFYDDIANNQFTLANKLELEELTKLFKTEVLKTYESLFKTLYSKKSIYKTLLRISVFLSVFNLGLQRYKKLNIKTTNWEKIRKMERKTFIIDMAKAANIFKLFVEVCKSGKLLNLELKSRNA